MTNLSIHKEQVWPTIEYQQLINGKLSLKLRLCCGEVLLLHKPWLGMEASHLTFSLPDSVLSLNSSITFDMTNKHPPNLGFYVL